MSQATAVAAIPQILYPLEDAKKFLGLRDVGRVRRLINNGHLEAVVLPGSDEYRVTLADLEKFVAAHRVTGPHRIAVRHPGRNGKPVGRPKGEVRPHAR
jgi:hypothetical protein